MLNAEDISAENIKSGIGGYKKKETEDYISTIRNEYELLLKENIELKDKLGILSEGVQYYKNMEKSLQKALVLAEKTTSETMHAAEVKAVAMEKEAKTRAELITKEAKMKADSYEKEATSKAENLMRQAKQQADRAIAEGNEQLRKIHSQVVTLVQQYEQYKSQYKQLAKAQIQVLESDAYNLDAPILQTISATIDKNQPNNSSEATNNNMEYENEVIEPVKTEPVKGNEDEKKVYIDARGEVVEVHEFREISSPNASTIDPWKTEETEEDSGDFSKGYEGPFSFSDNSTSETASLDKEIRADDNMGLNDTSVSNNSLDAFDAKTIQKENLSKATDFQTDDSTTKFETMLNAANKEDDLFTSSTALDNNFLKETQSSYEPIANDSVKSENLFYEPLNQVNSFDDSTLKMNQEIKPLDGLDFSASPKKNISNHFSNDLTDIGNQSEENHHAMAENNKRSHDLEADSLKNNATVFNTDEKKVINDDSVQKTTVVSSFNKSEINNNDINSVEQDTSTKSVQMNFPQHEAIDSLNNEEISKNSSPQTGRITSDELKRIEKMQLERLKAQEEQQLSMLKQERYHESVASSANKQQAKKEQDHADIFRALHKKDDTEPTITLQDLKKQQEIMNSAVELPKATDDLNSTIELPRATETLEANNGLNNTQATLQNIPFVKEDKEGQNVIPNEASSLKQTFSDANMFGDSYSNETSTKDVNSISKNTNHDIHIISASEEENSLDIEMNRNTALYNGSIQKTTGKFKSFREFESEL